MSIIDRLRVSAHLDEAALVSLWTDASLDGMPLAHPHLEHCAACRHRFAELGAWLESVRLDAVADADEQFPAERLAAQHAQIFRRLEAADRPARVIVFPASTPPLTSRSSHAARWIAAAAAACFIVGVGVGQLMDLRHALNPRRPVASTGARLTPSGPVARAGAVPLQNATGHEEVFLSELEASISRAPAALRALDAFTPRAGDRSR